MKRMLDKLQVQKARASTVSESENSITVRFSYSPKSFPILLTIKHCLMLQLIGSIYEGGNLTNKILQNSINPLTNVELYGYLINAESENYIDITFDFSSTEPKNRLKDYLKNPIDVLTYSLDIGEIEV